MANKLLCKKEILNSLQIIQRRNKTTVDSGEVYRFSQLVQEWWNLDGRMKPLHNMNNLRIPFIRDGLVKSSEWNDSTCLKGKKILDVGCGGGILSEGLARTGAEITGIDANEDLIKLAQYHSLHNNDLANNRPHYIYTTIEEHVTVNTEKYDAVVASEVIEHVNERELFLKSCVRATKPNGKLFFTTPSRTRFTQIYGIFLRENVFGTIPKGTHQYEKLMTPSELKAMLKECRCSVESTRGFYLNPITNKWKWCNNYTMSFAIEAVKTDRISLTS